MRRPLNMAAVAMAAAVGLAPGLRAASGTELAAVSAGTNWIESAQMRVEIVLNDFSTYWTIFILRRPSTASEWSHVARCGYSGTFRSPEVRPKYQNAMYPFHPMQPASIETRADANTAEMRVSMVHPEVRTTFRCVVYRDLPVVRIEGVENSAPAEVDHYFNLGLLAPDPVMDLVYGSGDPQPEGGYVRCRGRDHRDNGVNFKLENYAAFVSGRSDVTAGFLATPATEAGRICGLRGLNNILFSCPLYYFAVARHGEADPDTAAAEARRLMQLLPASP